MIKKREKRYKNTHSFIDAFECVLFIVENILFLHWKSLFCFYLQGVFIFLWATKITHIYIHHFIGVYMCVCKKKWLSPHTLSASFHRQKGGKMVELIHPSKGGIKWKIWFIYISSSKKRGIDIYPFHNFKPHIFDDIYNVSIILPHKSEGRAWRTE